MQSFLHKFKCLFFSLTISCAYSFLSPQISIAQDGGSDPALDAQRANCGKNTSTEWSSSLNRCVRKVEDDNARKATLECGKITDVEQKKACFQKIAEQQTGMNGNADELPQGTGGKSAILNGAAAAYSIIGMISGIGSSKKKSECTSKKIFGYTSFAGVATDIWLKIRTKQKLEELKKKYQVDVNTKSYDAQLTAFQYLREEQEFVKDVAGKEKIRNIALTLGYGAASAMAIYEMMFPQANPQCYKKELECKPKVEEEVNGKCEPVCPKGETRDPETSICSQPCEGGAEKIAGKCPEKPAEPKKEETPPPKKEETPPPPKKEETPPPKKEETPPPKQEETPPPKKEEVPPPKKEEVVVEADKVEKPKPPPPKDQYVVQTKNGVTQVYEVDANGKRTGNFVSGANVYNSSGVKIGSVNPDTMNFKSFGSQTEVQLADLKKYGVQTGGITANMNRIEFGSNTSGVRSTINGSTIKINDGVLKLNPKSH